MTHRSHPEESNAMSISTSSLAMHTLCNPSFLYVICDIRLEALDQFEICTSSQRMGNECFLL
jgi:hypothetical protein